MSGISFWPIKIKTTVRERWFLFSVFHEHGTKKIPREELNLRPSDSALQRFITKPKRLYCEPRHFFCVSHFRVREKEIFPLFLTELRFTTFRIPVPSSKIIHYSINFHLLPQPGLSMITLGNEINWYQFIKIDNNSSMSQATNQWFMDKGNSCNCHHDLTATVDFYRLLYIFRIGSLESSILISKGQ